jgi:hypothetical protein
LYIFRLHQRQNCPQKSHDHIKKWTKIVLRLVNIFCPHQSKIQTKLSVKITWSYWKVDENCPPFSGHISSISKQNTDKIVRENHVIILKVDENCPLFSGHISSTSKQDTDKIGRKSHVITLKNGRKLTISFSGHALSTYYADIGSEPWLTMKGYNLWLVTWSARLDPLLIGRMGCHFHCLFWKLNFFYYKKLFVTSYEIATIFK